MTNFLDIVGAGFQTSDRDLTAGISGMRSGHEIAAARIRIDAEFPTLKIFTILCSFCQTQIASIEVVCKANRCSVTCGDGDLLGIGAGAVIQCIDAAVRVSDFLHIVSSCRKAGDGDLATAVGSIRTGNQGGAGTVAVNTELPSGKILAIFCGLGQTQVTKIGRIELEVSIDIARRGIVEADTGLIGGSGHVPDGIGRSCCGRNIPGCLEYSGFRDGTGLGNVQCISAFIELGTISICEAPVGKDSIAVIHGCFGSGERNIRCIGTGATSEAGAFHGTLNIGHQSVIVWSEVGNRCSSGIVKNVACSS